MVHDVVEVVVLGRHRPEVGEGVLERRVHAGTAERLLQPVGGDLGVGLGDRRVADDGPADPVGRGGRRSRSSRTRPSSDRPPPAARRSRPAPATAMTSSVHCSSEYDARCPLSPCPDRSTHTTRNSSLNVAATWVHQWAWAPPPWTNTRPRVPGRAEGEGVDGAAVDVDHQVAPGDGQGPGEPRRGVGQRPVVGGIGHGWCSLMASVTSCSRGSAGEPAVEVGGEQVGLAPEPPEAAGRVVRGDPDPRMGPERVVRREWLGGEDVERGGHRGARVERGEQRLLVDERPPADVDQHAAAASSRPGSAASTRRSVPVRPGPTGRPRRPRRPPRAAGPGSPCGRPGRPGHGVRRQPMTWAPRALARTATAPPMWPSPTTSHVVPDTSRQSWIRQVDAPAGAATRSAPWNSSSTARSTNSAIGRLLTWALQTRTPASAISRNGSASYPAAGDWNHRSDGHSTRKRKKAPTGAPSRNRSEVPQATSGRASVHGTAAPVRSTTVPSCSMVSHSMPGRVSRSPKASWATEVQRMSMARSSCQAPRTASPGADPAPPELPGAPGGAGSAVVARWS